MYYPTHRPQLTGIPTEAEDCGVRATQMGLDSITKGQVVRSVKAIREIMGGDQDATNYEQWDRVVDELGGNTLGFAGEKTNDWQRFDDHVSEGGSAILAVHYGTYRKSMPNKAGSLTFDGYHAILFINQRKVTNTRETRSFDALLDGRYKGCPNGPVWVSMYKVRKAAEKVGQLEVGADKVYGLLLHPDASVAPTEPGDLLPSAGMTLGDLISDLRDIQATVGKRARAALATTIDQMEALVGIVGNPEADANTEVKSGIKV